MASECKHCKEISVDPEDQTCRSCGVVEEELKFGASDYKSIPKNRVYFNKRCHLKTAKSVKPPAGLLHGLDVLNNLCHSYTLPSERQAEIISLFKLVYNARSYARREHIGGMAGCCLLQVQAKYKEFVSIKELCTRLDLRVKIFYNLLKFLRSFIKQGPYSETLSSNSTSSKAKNGREPDFELPESVKALIPVVLEHAPKNEKAQLIDRTTKFVELANSCWLLTGRSPRSVVLGCAFLCWKSMRIRQKTASLKQFCDQFRIYDRHVTLRIPELKKLLLRLGCQIPYQKHFVTTKDVLFYLNYILDNSKTLRYDLLENEETNEAMNCKEFNTFRIAKGSRSRSKGETNQCDLDLNASDVEISDTEINAYLRSDEEKQFIETLQNRKRIKEEEEEEEE